MDYVKLEVAKTGLTNGTWREMEKDCGGTLDSATGTWTYDVSTQLVTMKEPGIRDGVGKLDAAGRFIVTWLGFEYIFTRTQPPSPCP